MKIRTRHKLLKAIMVLAVLTFLVSLYDMFYNDASWEAILLITYVVLAFLALLLYIGFKPSLEKDEPIVTEELRAEPAGVDPLPAPLPVDEPLVAEEIVEIPRRHTTAGPLEGPHTFKCPFCSNTFALEASHIQRKADFRMNCPFCGNDVKIPQTPHLTRARGVDVRHARTSEKALYTCSSCGEVLRVTAPGSLLERFLNIRACPNCNSRQMVPATPA